MQHPYLVRVLSDIVVHAQGAQLERPLHAKGVGPHALAGANGSAAGATDREIILHALQAVEQAIAPATALAPTDRTQITDVLVELRDELTRPQPNLLRLRSGLVDIATPIQTLGAAAYQLVKGALALLGVRLP